MAEAASDDTRNSRRFIPYSFRDQPGSAGHLNTHPPCSAGSYSTVKMVFCQEGTAAWRFRNRSFPLQSPSLHAWPQRYSGTEKNQGLRRKSEGLSDEARQIVCQAATRLTTGQKLRPDIPSSVGIEGRGVAQSSRFFELCGSPSRTSGRLSEKRESALAESPPLCLRAKVIEFARRLELGRVVLEKPQPLTLFSVI